MERKRHQNVEAFWFWRKTAWAVYLLGLPFIVYMFLLKDDYLFAAIELGGAPAMLCGIIAATRRRAAPMWLDWIALGAIPIGLGYSLYYFGGVTTFDQGLEIAGSAGFLIGTYLLSKDREGGYNWFMLMNVATGWLLLRQGFPWFVPQQILSITFTMDARRVRQKHILLKLGAALRSPS